MGTEARIGRFVGRLPTFLFRWHPQRRQLTRRGSVGRGVRLEVAQSPAFIDRRGAGLPERVETACRSAAGIRQKYDGRSRSRARIRQRGFEPRCDDHYLDAGVVFAEPGPGSDQRLRTSRAAAAHKEQYGPPGERPRTGGPAPAIEDRELGRRRAECRVASRIVPHPPPAHQLPGGVHPGAALPRPPPGRQGCCQHSGAQAGLEKEDREQARHERTTPPPGSARFRRARRFIVHWPASRRCGTPARPGS